jgi:hypothetical protein
VQFFSAFGTQAALIAGAQFVALAEIRTEDSDNNVIYSYVFWLFNALTIGLALHVLLCSVYIAVYGQGLALRGPIGSMVVAVEGMVAEQEQVVNAFTVMMISLACGTMGAFFVQMEFYGACAACVIMLACVWLWYHYCLRIYNRFKFLPAHSRWDSRSKGSVDNPMIQSVVTQHLRRQHDLLQKERSTMGGGSVDPSSRDTEVELLNDSGHHPELTRASLSHRPSFSENMRSSFSKLVGNGGAAGPPSVSSYVPPMSDLSRSSTQNTGFDKRTTNTGNGSI